MAAEGGALGMIEVKGLVAMMAAVEAMTTTAAVECVMLRRVSGGYLAAAVRGDLASVRLALDVGSATARRYSSVRDAQVQPDPHPSSLRLLASSAGWLTAQVGETPVPESTSEEPHRA